MDDRRNRKRRGHAHSSSGRSGNHAHRNAPYRSQIRRTPQTAHDFDVVPGEDVEGSVVYDDGHHLTIDDRHTPPDDNVGVTEPQSDTGILDMTALSDFHPTSGYYGNTTPISMAPISPNYTISSPTTPQNIDVAVGEWGSSYAYRGQHPLNGSRNYVLSTEASIAFAGNGIGPVTSYDVGPYYSTAATASTGTDLCFPSEPRTRTGDTAFNPFETPMVSSPSSLEPSVNNNSAWGNNQAPQGWGQYTGDGNHHRDSVDSNSSGATHRWSVQNNHGSVV
ncbi:hypothetical protein F5Y04DRAFT_277207 [Hypomontagnella monticulosa]|nr:hypothetical protein F5Y04DRAFT_277207 [Hypomontagnella monticulosa]